MPRALRFRLQRQAQEKERGSGSGRASLASAATEGVPGPDGRAGREHAGLCAAPRDVDAQDATEETQHHARFSRTHGIGEDLA